jgi:hypothetical protein
MDKEIYRNLTSDIAKIFALAIENDDFEGDLFFEQFRKKLSGHIFDLIQHDYNRLMIILYRIDVDEKVVRNCLEGQGIFNVADSLADAIIARLIQKIKYRMGRG